MGIGLGLAQFALLLRLEAGPDGETNIRVGTVNAS
jgi:hypothetical protein